VRFIATLRVDDQTLGEPEVRDIHSLIEQTTRVVAQVEDHPLKIGWRFFEQRRDLALQILRGAFLELTDAQVAVTRLEQLTGYRGHLHDIANDSKVARFVEAFAVDEHCYFSVLLASHQRNRFDQRHIHCRAALFAIFPVLWHLGRADLDDLIARANSSAIGGRALDRRDDFDITALGLVNLNTEAVELAPRIDLHLFVLVGLHEAGVRIEFAHHSANGAGEEIVFTNRLHVVAPYMIEHAGEKSEIIVTTRRLTPRHITKQ